MELVSIIIPIHPAHNHNHILGTCLKSIVNQTYPKDKIELILLGDGCALKQELCPGNIKTTIYNFENHTGAASARNKGIELSKGGLAAFIDADCIAHDKWLENLVAGFKNDNIAGVGGKILNFENKCMNKDNIYGVANLSPFTGLGNAIYRKSVLEEIGYLDERLTVSEDADLSLRVFLKGYRIEYAPEAIVDHKHIKDMKEIIDDFFLYGRHIRMLMNKYKKAFRVYSFLGLKKQAFLASGIKEYLLKIGSYICGYTYELLREKIHLSRSIKRADSIDEFFKLASHIEPLSVTIDNAPLIKPNHIIWWRLEDGCRILNFKERKQYEFDDISSGLWEYIIDGKTKDDITKEVAKKYEVTDEELKTDFDNFVNQLYDKRLLIKA